jgi:alkanesulfonate monooxygenase SsuD/methylene tetrahydromethanopterin reductase-like flavin-dependent oxidoreductase (luciferase family)
MGDGWFALSLTDPEMSVPLLQRIRRTASDAGRDPDSIGFEAMLKTADAEPRDLLRRAHDWDQAGATHLAVDTRRADADSMAPYLEAVKRVGAALLR